MRNKIVLPLKIINTSDKLPALAVEAKINNIKGFFIIDTGAQVSLIAENLKDYSYEELFDVENVISVTEEVIQNVKLIEIYDVKFGRYKIDLGMSFVFDIHHVQERFKHKYNILGLLGLSFFMDNQAKIDIENKKLILHYNR